MEPNTHPPESGEVGKYPNLMTEEVIHTLDPFWAETSPRTASGLHSSEPTPPGPDTEGPEDNGVREPPSGSIHRQVVSQQQRDYRTGGRGMVTTTDATLVSTYQAPTNQTKRGTACNPPHDCAAPEDRFLAIGTDSVYTISDLTANWEKWEDQGWMHSKHAELFQCI